MIYKDGLDLIGNTPMISLDKIGYKNVYVKLEKYNPAGSIKDRIALSMVEGAERKGILNKESVLVEATSGNTGIALAMVGKLKGYKVIIIMPETMSMERRQLVKAFGAELILTECSKGMNGSIEKLNDLLKENKNYVNLGQFENEDNPRIHYEATGPEIYKELPDVDVVIAGIGSGGTISGIGKFLKEKNENVKVYLDISMKRFKTIFPAAGSSNSSIELTCDELERFSHAHKWVDVCKEYEEIEEK